MSIEQTVIGSIHAALHDMQVKLSVPKNRLNKFGGYNYRNCEDILEAIKSILPPGASVVINDDIIQIGDRFYVKSTASFNMYGQSVSSTALAREALEKKGMDSSQITGSTSSYARKYALNGLFCIDDSVDSDESNDHAKQEKAPYKAPVDHTKAVAPKESIKGPLQAIQFAVHAKDSNAAVNAWKALSKELKTDVWGSLTSEEKAFINNIQKPQPDYSRA